MFATNVDLEHRRLSLAPIFMPRSAGSSTGAGVFIIWSGEVTPPRTRAKLVFSVTTLGHANRSGAPQSHNWSAIQAFFTSAEPGMNTVYF